MVVEYTSTGTGLLIVVEGWGSQSEPPNFFAANLRARGVFAYMYWFACATVIGLILQAYGFGCYDAKQQT